MTERFREYRQYKDCLLYTSVLEGTVKNITSYGVFIDLGGVDGLIHITDPVSYTHLDVYKRQLRDFAQLFMPLASRSAISRLMGVPLSMASVTAL